MRSSPLYQVTPGTLAAGALAAIGVAILVGVALSAAVHLAFFLIWAGLFAGGLVGETLLRVTRRKRGPVMEVTAGVAAALGCLIGLAVWYVVKGFAPDPAALGAFFGRNPFFGVAVALAIAAAVARVRFL